MATRGRLLLVMGVLALSALVLTSASERGSTGRTGSHGDGSDEGHDAERSAEGEIPNLRDELGNDTEGKVPPPKQEAPNLKKKGKTVLKGAQHESLPRSLKIRGMGALSGLRSAMLGDWEKEYNKVKKRASIFIERKDVRSFKSILLMLDLFLVVVSIQSQLDSMRERNVDYALSQVTDVQGWKKAIGSIPFVQGSSQAATQIRKITHLEKSSFFRSEMFFSLEASMTILASLLGEKLVHLWCQGERWLKKPAEMVDVAILSLSMVFEYIFTKMEHDGSLKTQKGSLLRWVVENWRFVRIIHGSYETLEHSPLIAPLLKGKGNKGH